MNNKCPYCHSVETYKNGHRDGKQRMKCKSCGKQFTIKAAIKILLVDIETAPIKALVWSVWNTNVSVEQMRSDWFVLTWSAKWLNDNEGMGEMLKPSEVKKENDKRIIKTLWKLFDEADIIIAHNGHKFDKPKLNSRFITNGLKQPSPYQVIDTLKVARQRFGFTYNRLDYLAELFGLQHKLTTGFSLWVKCLNGDANALEYMLKYNKYDVILLEEVYLKIRGWIKSHPNINLYQGTDSCCSNCGSENIRRKGSYTTMNNRYITYVCNDCGSFSKKSSVKKRLLSSTAR